MGESACLLRSFSHPSDASRELREGDPIRALTESVSFGRFMSESLAWEKWSAFSHNRYLEEVEKFAKPGSVAQKKAYFEAHYRRKAALREASHVEEPSSTPDVENPTTESDWKEQEHYIERHERQKDDSSDPSVDVSVSFADVPPEESKSKKVEVANTGSLEQGPAADSITQDDNLTQMHNSDRCVEMGSSKSETKEADGACISTDGKKRMMSSSKSSGRSKASKLLLPRANVITTIERRTGKDSAPRVETLVVEKKKSASKSLHMSINYGSTNKTLSPVLQQIRKVKHITASIKLQQESPIAQKLPTRASTDAKSKVTLTNPKSEERCRTKTLLNKSVAGRTMMDKSSSSLSQENSKYSITNGSKGQSPTVCSPFSFMSEERAAKRKEKQEEKVKAIETEKVKPREGYRFPNTRPQSPKVVRKPPQHTGTKTKPRPPQQNLSKVDTANHVKGKSNSSTRASVPSLLLRNHVRENSSPNIPR